MCRRNIRESLTARIFLLTLLLLLGAGGLTFGLIAWATPITYVSVVGDRLQVQVSELTDRLALTKLADAGPILDVFVRESGSGGIPGEPRRGECGHGLPLCVRHHGRAGV